MVRCIPRVEILYLDSDAHLIRPFQYSAGGHVSHERYRDHDETDEYERPGPGQTVPVIIGGECVDVNLQRQRGDRLVETGAPELIAEGGEEQRRSFASDAGKGQHAAGD